MSACTLGRGAFDFIPWPGPVVHYLYRGMVVPTWGAEVLPPETLTPVRQREVEEGIEYMFELFSRAAEASAESVGDALRRIARADRR